MGVRPRLRIGWRRVKYSPRTPDRKGALTFVLVATPVVLYWWFGEHWAIALLTAAVGVLLSTDYRVVDEYVSASAYEWVQDAETLLEAVEQNHHTAQYVARQYAPFELTYWKNGHFRATIPADRPVRPGMRFLVQCDVTSQDGRFTYPVPFCTTEVESVSAESNGKCELKLNLVRWLDEARTRNTLDREVYREKTRELRNGFDSIAPKADVHESDEVTDLTPAEWKKLSELLDETEIYEAKR